ncbi:MAG: amino acid--tRNA ligase-related protein [Bacteriovoracaceae bacterium]
MDNRLKQQFALIQIIRDFFNQQNFTDVLTPPMVMNPGYEAHIHPFSVYSTINKKLTGEYLQTSPEFYMKHLLSEGFDKIFNISYCFRDEPSSPIHRNQFLMLEWYRTNAYYDQIMNDCEALVNFAIKELKKKSIKLRRDEIKFQRKTVQEIFDFYLKINILDFENVEKIKKLLLEKFPDVPVPKSDKLLWDDYFFLLFLNRVEPFLKEDFPFLILYEFPEQLSALSTIKKDNPKVCERFEIFINGVELANCFNELRDIKIQKARFDEQNAIKKNLYKYELPQPEILFSALEKGFPASAGIALGVERLLYSICDIENPFFK